MQEEIEEGSNSSSSYENNLPLDDSLRYTTENEIQFDQSIRMSNSGQHRHRLRKTNELTSRMTFPMITEEESDAQSVGHPTLADFNRKTLEKNNLKEESPRTESSCSVSEIMLPTIENGQLQIGEVLVNKNWS